MRAKLFPIHFMVLVAVFSLAFQSSANAQIDYISSTFANRNVVVSDATQYSITADILEGGNLAGSISGTLTYGGGSNPFVAPNWNSGSSLLINGLSVDTAETVETADANWSFSITPAAGYQVEGISLFSNGTSIANPTFANLTSNGVATVTDANEGTATELFNNYNSGAFTNGTDLVFNTGSTNNGIPSTAHTGNWSYDSAGATQLSFDYLAGPVPNISNEGLRLDVQLSTVSVPEPSSLVVVGLMGSLAVLRRRKK